MPGGGFEYKVTPKCSEDCRTVRWSPVTVGDRDVLQFSLKGFRGAHYIAVAFSQDDLMGPYDDVYICSRNDPSSSVVTIHTGVLIGHQAPTSMMPVKEDNLVHYDVTDDVITCSFLRELSVTKITSGLSQTWNLDVAKFHLLYAEGDVTKEGGLQTHSFAASSEIAFHFRFVTVSSTTNTPEVTKPDVDPSVEVDEGGADSGKTENSGTWVIPNSECPDDPCKTVRWSTDERSPGFITFTLSGSSAGWIAAAISRDATMGNDDCYVCARESPASSKVIVTSGHLIGHTSPMGRVPVKADNVLSAVVSDYVMNCTFRRDLAVTKEVQGAEVTWDVREENFRLLYAEGELYDDGGMKLHKFRKSTHDALNLLDSSKNIDETSEPDEFLPTEKDDVILTSSGGSWLVPHGCTSECRKVDWETRVVNGQTMVAFVIIAAGSYDYAGILISDDVTQGAGDCYYCLRDASDDVTIMSATCSSESFPIVDGPLPEKRVLEADVSDDIMTCSFLRPISVIKLINGEEKNFDISRNKYRLSYGEGTTTENGGLNPPTYGAFTLNRIRLLNLTSIGVKDAVIAETTATPTTIKSYEETTSASSHPIVTSLSTQLGTVLMAWSLIGYL
ncbi:unnamed protein product [Clavelina lepadiformis]|uniref:DOMON domain-containing protein n=1 Tax=Clavelina lepadiformis TaxID=159417 RepID=A0ABP0FED4_CLALP